MRRILKEGWEECRGKDVMKFKGRMVKNIKRRMDVMKFKGWENVNRRM